MTQLTNTTAQLPAAPEDLAKFILVGREKLQSVRAEIRAIDKLHLAEEVREQKRDEARMLSEALLDAEVRIGELFKLLPKAPGTRTDIQPRRITTDRLATPETKALAVKRLGFSQDQAERFEALASHPEEVAQAKAEARENDDLPTRTAVLSLIKRKQENAERERQEADAQSRQADEDYRLAALLNKTVASVKQLPTDSESIIAMRNGMPFAVNDMVWHIQQAIHALETILRQFEKR